MRLWIGYFCVAIVFVVAVTILTVVINKFREKYVLLRNVGKFPLQITRSSMLPREDDDDDDDDSSKYSGHRYDRNHMRRNPHGRRYQD